ncbi:MAG: Gfo/Idh/MocA family oxidoreductase [Betaproteobacteria bacterium]|nr:Gfo/Idh/MocA family oxidoreductase [Betaproteobacteria bacterium]MDE2046788.1 Gfo/Idh/MocA family oxidoreductase [Betaproteobacteria bacterium]
MSVGSPHEQLSPVRIAVVGAGAIGRKHLALVEASTACTLAAIVDPSPAAGELARAHHLPWFRTLTELLASDRPAGAIVATPNTLHVDNALECIAAGVAVLVEKPISHSVREAEKLCHAVDSTGARVLIGHHRAHSPTLAKARDVIREGRLGRLVAATGTALFHKPERYFADAPWRRQLGGGPILINLIHDIGNLRSLCGNIVAVQAFGSNATRGFDVEDTAAIALRFASGALGTLLLSDCAASARSWEQTSKENKDYAAYDDEDCYLIAGTLGSLAIPTMRLKTYPDHDRCSWFEPFEASSVAVDRRDPLALQLEHFCALTRGEVAPLVSARDGLLNLRVVEAIAQAAREGVIVEVT